MLLFRLATVVPILSSLIRAAPWARSDNRTASICGAYVSDEELFEAEAKFVALKAARVAATRPEGVTFAAAPIPIYWHVITATDATGQVVGDVTNQQIADTLTVLNKAYAVAGLSFTLAGVSRTANPVWFSTVDASVQVETQMKQALRQGDRATLNVYSAGFSNPQINGFSSFAFYYDRNPILDGVVIHYGTVYGGIRTGANFGLTLVHETGHWCGLLHPFQGGCTGTGDFVADTPPTAEAIQGCPASRDSCPGGGADLVHNYMDYGAADCRNSFTPGQIQRIKAQILEFRGITA